MQDVGKLCKCHLYLSLLTSLCIVYLSDKIKMLQVCISDRHRPRKKQKNNKSGKGKEWLLRKKEQMRRRGNVVPPNTKYTGRKRKDRFWSCLAFASGSWVWKASPICYLLIAVTNCILLGSWRLLIHARSCSQRCLMEALKDMWYVGISFVFSFLEGKSSAIGAMILYVFLKYR